MKASFNLKWKIFLFFLTFITVSFSQEVKGIVIDGVTNKPIQGASVYFDNTTIGTSSNKKGEFVLKYDASIETPLVVTFIGYEMRSFKKSLLGKNMKIYLSEARQVLGEVMLSYKDPWSRDFKLKEFLRHYLGESFNAKASRILNTEDLILRYSKTGKRLIARAKKPILIENDNLKYLITVKLNHFEVNYTYVSDNKKELKTDYVYYAGSNFFKSTEDIPSKTTLNNRKAVYKGSVLHFMRALAKENLNQEGFKIYRNKTLINPKRYITVIKDSKSKGVVVKLKDKLNIFYKEGTLSTLESFVDEFYIDAYGNHFPPDKIRFDGELGLQRMGEALPMNYRYN